MATRPCRGAPAGYHPCAGGAMRQHVYRLLACATAIGLIVTGVGLAHRQRAQATPHTAIAAAGLGSSGCGHAWQGGVDSRDTLPFGGLQRTYLLHVPPTYSPTTPW